MKRVWILILSTALVLGAVLALCACGLLKTDLPSTDYEKVKYAFNGVEKSFRSAEGGTASLEGDYVVRRLLSAGDDPLARIRAIYEAGDDQGDVIDGLEYTQPPMIQFQCLKSVLDKTGKSFAFDTKYYDEVTGTVFVDPATGYSMADDENKDEYKYDYLFRLGLKITIDQNDLIKADVSFTIRLTRGEESYVTNWYVGMVLDYDMTSETPDYTLAMYTANDEGALPYIGLGNVYEYDFVKVDENKIKEWRKFVMETDVVLVKDDAHPTFASYRNDGVNFRADTCKWYYDGTLKKITRHDAEKDAALADLFFDFGLNATAIDGTPFLTAEGVVNDAIQTSYREFSEIFRMDVIYSLVCKRKDDSESEGNQKKEAVGISVFTQEGEAWTAKTVEHDATLSELLSNTEPWGQGFGVTRPVLYTVDKNGNKIDPIVDLDDYDYSVHLGDAPEISFRAKFPLDELLSDTVANRLGGMQALEENGFLVTVDVHSKNGDNYFTSFSLIVGLRSEIEDKDAKEFPAALTEIGVPTYETEEGSFKLTDGKQDGYTLEVKTNNDERTAYLKKLTDGGFVQDNENAYVKVDGEYVLFITVNRFESGDTLRITARRQANNGDRTYSSTFPAETVTGWVDGKFVIPTPTASGNLLYSYNTDGKYLYIFGMTNEEIAAYVDAVANRENTRFVGERMITTYYEGRFYTIEYNTEPNALYFELNLERYGAQEPQMYVSVNGGEAQPFWWDGMFYTVTVTLAEGDTFVFTPDVGKVEDPKAFTFSEGTYTVVAGGTYTFTGLPGDIHFTKN